MKSVGRTTKGVVIENERRIYHGFTNGNACRMPGKFSQKREHGKFTVFFVMILLVLSVVALFTFQSNTTSVVRIDGSFEDWQSVAKTSKIRDVNVPENIDISEYATVETGKNVAFYARVYGSLLAGDGRYIVETPSDNPVYMATQRETTIPNANGRDVAYVFVDTDNNPGTGFKPSANFAVGADKAIEIVGKNGKIEASRVLTFVGVVQQEWTWVIGESVAAATNGKDMETMAGKNLLGVGENYAVYFYMIDWQNMECKLENALRCENAKISAMDMYLKAVDERTVQLIESKPFTPKGTPRTPIRINGDADFTPINGVVSGSGTQADPYIIENWDIDAAGQGCGIYIGNTTSYFVVRNCYVNNSSGNAAQYYWNSGIALYSVVHGILGRNLILNCTSYGIYIAGSSSQNTVYLNTVSNNNYGIYLSSSTLNRIDENNVSGNNYGVILSSSSTNRVTNNTISSNTNYGIYLATSNTNLILYNHLRNNGGYGVYLTTGSNSNAIWWNSFWQNNGAGRGVSGNCQAYDGVGANDWNNTTRQTGNYWSNWDGNDWASANAYPIDGGAGASDWYPLSKPARAPIRINSDADFTLENGVVGGSGTSTDPYIIDGWLIDGAGYGYCIYIGNTTKDFVIENCELHDAYGNSDMYYWDAGLALYNATNATIIKNHIYSCTYGIWMYHTSYLSMYSTLKYNGINQNKYGVICWNVREITISYNRIDENEYNGIDITSGMNMIITNNNISRNNYRGIYLLSTTNSEITYNQFYRNAKYAIGFASGSLNNIICYNNFWQNNPTKGINGNPQAYDGEGNTWYNSAYHEGNYWDNWDGMDWGTSKAYQIDGGLTSDYYPLSKPALGPIQILSNEQFAEMKNLMDWDGDGSQSDPYLIDGYLCNARGGSYGIKIENTNVSFVISNCDIMNATATNAAGISLRNVTGGLIQDNRIINNYVGIYTTYSIIDILKNAVSNNIVGLYLYENTNYTNVTENELSNNSNHGVSMVYANNCTIDNNTFFGQGYYGLATFACQNISVASNDFYNNSIGLYVTSTINFTAVGNKVLNNTNAGIYLDTIDTTISYNNISNNKNYGLIADMCYRTNITYNDFYYNTNYSVYFRLTPAMGNYVHHNYFYGNNNASKGNNDGKCQARDDTGATQWYDAVTHEGNYWSNWNGSGWGTPLAYPIDGSAGASDWYPLGYGKRGPIHINGNADFAAQAAGEGWQGDGTEGNPYIIERLEIDANGGSYCIWIENTDVHFIVRDCDLHNTSTVAQPYAALAFSNVKNGTCENINIYDAFTPKISSSSYIWLNNFTADGVTIQTSDHIVVNASNTGMWFWQSCSYIRITNNTLTGGKRIDVWETSNCEILNNTVTGAVGGEAIKIFKSTNTTIINNTLTNNKIGIGLSSSSTHNYIANNNISSNSQCGIYGTGSYNDYTTIINNNISNNGQYNFEDGGIILVGHYNNITNNYLGTNKGYGIWVFSSDYVSITNNTIVGIGSTRGLNVDGAYGVISNNTITGNSDYGVVLETNYAIFMNNNCSGNGNGIYIHGSNNTIARNTLLNNVVGIALSYISSDNNFTENYIAFTSTNGIKASDGGSPGARRNLITYNTIISSGSHGIYLSSSTATGNIIHHNRFIGNNGATKGVSGNCQAYDSVGGNYWFDSVAKEGNYWSNWDRNGWGTASAYPIAGGAGASDWYPLRTARGTIHITSNSEFTSENGVVSGAGTQANPYIIAGWEIDAAGSTYGIWIENTDAYFTIHTCLVWNATGSGSPPLGAGIALNNVRNGKIENNICNGSRYGIYLYGGSTSNTVINNNASNNQYRGIFLASSSTNQILNNTVFNNTIGIYLTASSYNTLSGNQIKSNSQHGFYISAASNSNTIINNDIKSNTQYGIYIYSSSQYNDITNNNITKNGAQGVYIYSSINNNITNNWIYKNTNYGVYITSSSSGNTVVGNRFVGNNGAGKGVSGNCQAYDNVAGNNWYNGTAQQGNYWSNWDGNDWGTASAYPIDGGVASDWYPIQYLHHGPIHITSNSEFTPDNGVVDGTGTASDPFIIEGLEIDANGGTYAIWVENTDAYFIIRKCLLWNATNSGTLPGGSGIALRNVQNGVVENNICNNSRFGIFLYDGSTNNSLSSNNCWDNLAYGIYLFASWTVLSDNAITNNVVGIFSIGDNNTIINNTISWNTNQGIAMYSSNDNIIENNTVIGTSSGDGIYLEDVRNTKVTRNYMMGNGRGIQMYSSTANILEYNEISTSIWCIYLNASEANAITHNILYGSSRGIYLYSTNNTAILENNINNNTQCGIYLYSSRNTTMANNTIADNGNYGVYLTQYSNDNTITYNTISRHTSYGVYITFSSTANYILRNNFLNNSGNKGYAGTSQAYDDVGGNFWYDNIAQEGNHWSNWDGHGWGSADAYPIDGGVDASDRYPLGGPVSEFSVLPWLAIALLCIISFMHASRKRRN